MGEGKGASFDAGVQLPLSLEVALHVCPRNKGPLHPHLWGRGTAPPGTQRPQPPRGGSQARTAARPLEALFSLGFWALGSFFSEFFQNSVG